MPLCLHLAFEEGGLSYLYESPITGVGGRSRVALSSGKLFEYIWFYG